MAPKARVIEWPAWRKHPLSQKQWFIYEDDAKRQLLNCGRGFGKDFVSVLRCLKLAFKLYYERIQNPDWYRDGPIVNVAIIAPVSSNYEPTWKKLVSQIPRIPGRSVDGTPNCNILKKDRRIELFGTNGINISFYSAFRDDYIRGDGFDILVVTEAAFLTKDTYLTVLEPLVKRPGYAGYIMLISTPSNNWWDVACDEALKAEGHFGNFKLWQASTFENPKCDDELREVLRTEKDTNPLRYRRDRMAELFIDVPEDDLIPPEDLRVFPWDLIELAFISDPIKLGGPYFIGIDLAYGGKDSLAVVVIDASTMTVVHTEVHDKTEDGDIVRIMERLNREWNVPKITYDGNGRGATLEPHLKGRGLRAKPLKYDTDGKAKMVGRLSNRFVTQNIKLPHPERYIFHSGVQKQNAQRLVREARIYQAIPRNSGNRAYIWYGKPDKGTDDLIDALMLAVWALPTVATGGSQANHVLEIA